MKCYGECDKDERCAAMHLIFFSVSVLLKLLDSYKKITFFFKFKRMSIVFWSI